MMRPAAAWPAYQATTRHTEQPGVQQDQHDVQDDAADQGPQGHGIAAGMPAGKRPEARGACGLGEGHGVQRGVAAIGERLPGEAEQGQPAEQHEPGRLAVRDQVRHPQQADAPQHRMPHDPLEPRHALGAGETKDGGQHQDRADHPQRRRALPEHRVRRIAVGHDRADQPDQAQQREPRLVRPFADPADQRRAPRRPHRDQMQAHEQRGPERHDQQRHGRSPSCPDLGSARGAVRKVLTGGATAMPPQITPRNAAAGRLALREPQATLAIGWPSCRLQEHMPCPDPSLSPLAWSFVSRPPPRRRTKRTARRSKAMRPGRPRRTGRRSHRRAPSSWRRWCSGWPS